MHNLIIIVVLILYCDEFEKNVQSQVIQSEKYFKGYCTTLKIQYNYILCLYISIYILHMGQWYLMQALIQNHRQMIIFSYKYQIASLNTKKRIVTRNVKQNFQKLKTLPALNKYSLLLTIQISISKLLSSAYNNSTILNIRLFSPPKKYIFTKNRQVTKNLKITKIRISFGNPRISKQRALCSIQELARQESYNHSKKHIFIWTRNKAHQQNQLSSNKDILPTINEQVSPNAR
eukprot:TRINITY_DN1031_c0_g1_i5.p1 TRINITY_DN1031_c0_g1~~TRINITY_DN1031_c0_g1_i5.p1  ORF type:complete len:233 (+),score=-17.78 TRINITY_DN1031_c0_g1_i5:638-1336(+)